MDSNFVKLTVRAQYKFKASNNDEVKLFLKSSTWAPNLNPGKMKLFSKRIVSLSKVLYLLIYFLLKWLLKCFFHSVEISSKLIKTIKLNFSWHSKKVTWSPWLRRRMAVGGRGLLTKPERPDGSRPTTSKRSTTPPLPAKFQNRKPLKKFLLNR